MTIELSLRRRSTQARVFAIVWLTIAAALLVGTYVSLPFVAGKTLDSVEQIERRGVANAPSPGVGAPVETNKSTTLQAFALTTLVLGVLAASLAGYLVGKAGFMELERAGKLSGLADALCLAGNDFGQFEKAATILMLKSKFASGSSSISQDDIKSLLEVLRRLR